MLRVVTVICFVSIFLYVAISTQRVNILSNNINPHFKLINSTIFMESFGFFTKSPKHDETFDIYSIYNKRVAKLNLRNNSIYNLFGLSRKNRVRLVEMGKVLPLLKEDSWVILESDIFEKIVLKNTDTLVYKNIKLDVKGLKEGQYIITISKPIPWEWNKIKKTTQLKYVAVNIRNNTE
ncbi:hypothetical protein MNBD_BACTEROID03-213 [hydrothermal vent metagenome]|uniref:Uncharacterized protein n=1 Tax=hydrothermal vent metagenome TaxID=652676 RepID=A0A3B0TXF1_9ZZZZ